MTNILQIYNALIVHSAEEVCKKVIFEDSVEIGLDWRNAMKLRYRVSSGESAAAAKQIHVHNTGDYSMMTGESIFFGGGAGDLSFWVF
jgi:hypothetical protein